MLIVRTKDPTVKNAGAMGLGKTMVMTRITAINNSSLLRVDKGSNVKMDNCLFGGGQRGIHACVDDPATVLHMTNVIAGPKMTMEWNSRYPWKTLSLAEYFVKAGGGNIVMENGSCL